MSGIRNSLVKSIRNRSKKPTRIPKNPCMHCNHNITVNHKSISCYKCKFNFHINCNGTSIDEYNQLLDSVVHDDKDTNTNDNNNNNELTILKKCVSTICSKCVITERASNFPFGHETDYELGNLITADCMKALDNYPSYEIHSKASDINNLNKHDIDENTPTHIDSRYYSVDEFQQLKRQNCFNLLHTNLNGLERNHDQLLTFVNNTSMEIDIIALTETSQKENENFKTNISLKGYQQPFSIGSKTAKGGVAIFARNNIDL